MRCFLTIIVIVVLLVGGAAVFIGSGVYNVSSTSPHWGITHWFLETVRHRSIHAHSKDVLIPPSERAELAQAGISHFHETCRLCHGAPGHTRSEFAMGLYPAPPRLERDQVQKEWSDAELYWIVENGLKMTGMPAFGLTHDEDALRGMVVFVRTLPRMEAEEYQNRVEPSGGHHKGADEHRAPEEEAGHVHEHGEDE